jgi:arylsulfatase A-like enzyme
MVDQMQARVLQADHPCKTPNLDRLAARGQRFTRAYTSNAICSPARAGLMTGLLPHNHGVLTVTHVVDDDQCCLRTEHPHWAQRLRDAGYRTGYFGKWHVERTHRLEDFGWEINGGDNSTMLRERMAGSDIHPSPETFSLEGFLEGPGYPRHRFYGVTSVPPERRRTGVITDLAMEHLEIMLAGDEPWCCFVSTNDPHDPFICGAEAFAQYNVDEIPLPGNLHDELAGRPGLYRKAGKTFAGMTERNHREAAACYFACITEIDQQYGRILDRLEQSGQWDNTIVVFTTDHGELLGAHGLYCKNFTGSEEVYNIPLILAGPGIAAGAEPDARVGSHELCPTLLELTGCEGIDVPDSRSFAPVLADPSRSSEYTTGFAEYHGGRYILTQRIVYDGPWKLVFNGFDVDELYHLDDDPWEMTNLAERDEHRDVLRRLHKHLWRVIRDTGDRSLERSGYPILRIAEFGPGILNEDQ